MPDREMIVMEAAPGYADPRKGQPYRCRQCSKEEPAAAGALVPRGWYSLKRHSGDPGEGSQNLGVYCSANCLLARLPHIQHIERAMGPV